MTIRLELGLRRIQSLSSISNKFMPVAGGNSETPLSMSTAMKDEESGGVLSANILHYTSLRDLIAPEPKLKVATVEWIDITRMSFKNKLVEEAARAYLQPAVPPTMEEDCFLSSSWMKKMKEYAHDITQTCLTFLSVHVYMKFSNVFWSIAGKISPRLLMI